MEYPVFRSRFFAAVDDFTHKRRFKDELAAYASAAVHHLSMGQVSPPKMIVHQIMLAGAYPNLKEEAVLTVYHFCVPRLTRMWLTFLEYYYYDAPDEPTKLRSWD